MTSWYRPWVTILLQGIVVFLIATLLPSIAVIGNLCNVGVFLSFILPLVSLIILQRRSGKTNKVPLTILALIAAVGLSLYSIYIMADTMQDRLLYALPMLGALIIGALLMRGEAFEQKA